MPRRRMSGAVFAFLFGVLAFALGGCASEPDSVLHPDLSEFSRDEKIAYLILNDQLTELRRHLELTTAHAGEWMPMVCVRVAVDSATGGSVSPSVTLLSALREAESKQELGFEVVPASACKLENRKGTFSLSTANDPEEERIWRAVLIDTNALSPNRSKTVWGGRCEGYQYWGGWYTVGFVKSGICAGFCGVDLFYSVHEQDGLVSLTKSTCYSSN